MIVWMTLRCPDSRKLSSDSVRDCMVECKVTALSYRSIEFDRPVLIFISFIILFEICNADMAVKVLSMQSSISEWIIVVIISPRGIDDL